MVPKAGDPEAEVRRAIERRLGSLDKWATDFQPSAKVTAGWAMLAVHPLSGKLYNVVSEFGLYARLKYVVLCEKNPKPGLQRWCLSSEDTRGSPHNLRCFPYLIDKLIISRQNKL